jgi:hypothetical protein
MAQTLISVVLEVQPQNAERLRGLIIQLNDNQSAMDPAYAGMQAIRRLHFVAMTVFADDQYDPILVLEANFDPPAGPFWAALAAAIGPQLREALRCCKRPPGRTGEMFDAVTAPGAKTPIAPLLEALMVDPVVRHQGNRGMSRERIEQEAELFLDLRAELKDRGKFQSRSAAQVHSDLRAAILPRHAWLATKAPPAVGVWENFVDWLRLSVFAATILLILHLPGLFLASVLPPWWAVAAIAVVGLALGVALKSAWGQPPAGAPPVRAPKGSPQWGVILISIAGVLLFELFLAGAIFWLGRRAGGEGGLRASLIMAGIGLLGAVPTLELLLLGLRLIEARDSSQEAPPVDGQTLREIMAREDRVAQNHMASLTHLKPGVMRAILARMALWSLGLFVRVQSKAREGFLGQVRTIHFAQLALVNNGGRLMFLTNFDGSWENYLSDFIDKVHGAVTWVWSSAIGFPSTRFMVLDGASQSRLFKAWKRHSMAPSLFWFSAYRSLSVEQIKRHARIAEGLREAALTPEEAVRWAMDL